MNAAVMRPILIDHWKKKMFDSFEDRVSKLYYINDFLYRSVQQAIFFHESEEITS